MNLKEQRELINNSRTKFSKDYWISFLECESSSLFKIFHQIYSHAYCYFHNNLESMNEVSKLFLQFRTYLYPLLFKIDVSHFRNIDVLKYYASPRLQQALHIFLNIEKLYHNLRASHKNRQAWKSNAFISLCTIFSCYLYVCAVFEI